MQKKLESREYIFLYKGPSYGIDHMIGVLGQTVSPPQNRPAGLSSGTRAVALPPSPVSRGNGVAQEFPPVSSNSRVCNPSGSLGLKVWAGNSAQGQSGRLVDEYDVPRRMGRPRRKKILSIPPKPTRRPNSRTANTQTGRKGNTCPEGVPVGGAQERHAAVQHSGETRSTPVHVRGDEQPGVAARRRSGSSFTAG